MSRLTPGDWTAVHVASAGDFDNPDDLYEVSTEHARVAENLTEADARLVEAAKPMLEELKKALPALDMYYAYGWRDREGIRAGIRAVIKQATGEEL